MGSEYGLKDRSTYSILHRTPFPTLRQEVGVIEVMTIIHAALEPPVAIDTTEFGYSELWYNEVGVHTDFTTSWSTIRPGGPIGRSLCGKSWHIHFNYLLG